MAMLAVNLIICSLKRLPSVIKIVNKDPALDLALFPKAKESLQRNDDPKKIVSQAEELLGKKIATPLKLEENQETTLFAQKGAWTRYGVYVVHASVLIIFIGAIISNIWGVNGTLVIHEGNTEKEAELDGGGHFPLGFEVRLDKYTETYYEKFKNTPSEFRSDLVFIENGKEVAKAAVRVNHPFEWGGITFYQSFRGQSPSQFKARMIVEDKAHEVELFWQRWAVLPEGIRAGVMEFREEIKMGNTYNGPFARILVQDKEGHQHQIAAFAPGFKLPNKMGPDAHGIKFEIISAKVSWYTGLQIKKDPGVWWVWIGCGLMVLGFFVTFYGSHKKVWIRISPQEEGAYRVQLAGSVNKNRPAMHRLLSGLALALKPQAPEEE
jgi:cytochrome c biogenesis protein